MNWGTVGGIIGILTALGGVVRWLLSYWVKSQKEIADLKASYVATTMMGLKETILEHKRVLLSHAQKLQNVEVALVKNASRLEEARLSVNDVAVSFKEFVKKSEIKQEQFGVDLITLTKELILVKQKVK